MTSRKTALQRKLAAQAEQAERALARKAELETLLKAERRKRNARLGKAFWAKLLECAPDDPKLQQTAAEVLHELDGKLIEIAEEELDWFEVEELPAESIEVLDEEQPAEVTEPEETSAPPAQSAESVDAPEPASELGTDPLPQQPFARRPYPRPSDEEDSES